MLTALNLERGRTFWTVLLGFFIVAATRGLAADYSWDGKGTGGNLNDWLAKQNWGNTAAPGAADNGIFSSVLASNSVTPTLSGTASIQGIRYNAGAAAFTIGGAGALTLGSNGITNNSTTPQVNNLYLVLNAPQTWNANAGALSFGGPLNLQANALTIAGSQSVTSSGTISGTGGLVKNGAGILTLSDANTYSGGTTINGGRVAVNNTAGSGTGYGSVTINNNGTLGGTGSIAGVVTNNAGGTIAPGNSVGQLNTGTEVWNGGSTLLLEINSVNAGAGIGWDLLNISGGLRITATSGNKVFIDLRSLTLANTPGAVSNFDSSQNYIWTIARTISGVSFATGENEATVFDLLLGGFSNGLNGGSFSVALSNGGNDLNLVFTSVPEPGTWALMLIGLGGVWFARRQNFPRR